jgi:hypothetical protein
MVSAYFTSKTEKNQQDDSPSLPVPLLQSPYRGPGNGTRVIPWFCGPALREPPIRVVPAIGAEKAWRY